MIDKRPYFDIVKHARSLIKNVKPINKEVMAKHDKIVTRLRKAEKLPIDYTCKNTYYSYRSAWSGYFTEMLRLQLKYCDRLAKENNPDWFSEVDGLQLLIAQLKDCEADPDKKNAERTQSGEYQSPWSKKTEAARIKKLLDINTPLEAISVKINLPISTINRHIECGFLGVEGINLGVKSKKILLKKLPGDWTDRMFEHALSSESIYATAIATMAVTGCRPEELQVKKITLADGAVFDNGVWLTLNSDPLSIDVLILGAKTKDGKQGQVFRKFTAQCDSPEFNYLVIKLVVNGGSMHVTANAGSLKTTVRKFSQQVFPVLDETISSYCYRHRFSALVKKSEGFDREKVAMVLGHDNDGTQAKYSAANISASGFKITKVEAEKAIRPVTTARIERLLAGQQESSFSVRP